MSPHRYLLVLIAIVSTVVFPAHAPTGHQQPAQLSRATLLPLQTWPQLPGTGGNLHLCPVDPPHPLGHSTSGPQLLPGVGLGDGVGEAALVDLEMPNEDRLERNGKG